MLTAQQYFGPGNVEKRFERELAAAFEHLAHNSVQRIANTIRTTVLVPSSEFLKTIMLEIGGFFWAVDLSVSN